MADAVLRFLSDAVFLLVFVLTLKDLARYRDLPRLEVAALFGVLAAIIALTRMAALLPATTLWAGFATSFLLMSQPYLALRLLGHFQRVPRVQHIIALVSLVGSWAVFIATGPELPNWAIGIVVLAFAYVEGYVALSFVKAAVTTRGVAHLRLLAVAIGSGLIGLIILLAGLTVVLTNWREGIASIITLLGLASAVSYYIGFATPLWVRRVWQRAEVHQFLQEMSAHAMRDQVVTALEYLAPAAVRATGGKAAVVALANEDGTKLHPHTTALGPDVELEPLLLGPVSPILDRVWHEQRPMVTLAPGTWGAPLKGLAAAFGGARGALIAPLTASGQAYGLLVILIDRGVLFMDDDLAIVSILADQTAQAIERRRLFDEAERERARLTAVMSSMSDGVMLLDDANRVQYSNARAAELLGVRAEALVGASPANVSSGAEVESADSKSPGDAWQHALDRAETRPSFELRYPGSHSRDVLVEVFSVADAGGGNHGVGAALRDVTIERDLARTKDELVSVVSHELRTPLASVVGFAELLLSRPSMAEAPRTQYLGVMVEEGRRLTALINDFLDIQRLESGHQSIVPRPMGLRPVLEQAVIAAGEDPSRPIVIEAAEDLPLVRADADRLRQVLGNLLSNARKYSPNGGVIRLTASLLDGQACVSVQDQGLGLPANALPRLFAKFYRVDNSDRRQITGTGLGLAISRRIVEGHGGRIWAESAGLGAGARFSFTVPLAPPQADGGEVLVVEDGGSFAQLLEAELMGQGFSAVCVESAEEALTKISIAPPRMIVLDLLLPGMQGEAFLEHVRAVRGTTDLPVVVVTVKDLTPDEHEALASLGVRAILRKGPGVAATAARTVASTLGSDSHRAA